MSPALDKSMKHATPCAMKFIYFRVAEHDDQATWLLATHTGVYVRIKFCLAAGHTPFWPS